MTLRPETGAGPATAWRQFVAGLAILLVALPAAAQGVRVEPGLTASLSYREGSGDDLDETGDWTAEISPSVAVRRTSGRFIGSLDASLRNVIHTGASERSETFVSLQGNGQLEAVEKTLFIDMDASVSRSNPSLFTGRLPGDSRNTDRDNETRALGIGPRLNFRLGPEIDGTASYMARWQSGNGGLSGSRQTDTAVDLSNPTQFGRVGWGLSYTRADSEYDNSVRGGTSEEAARARLFVTVSPQLRLHGVVGRESNDYETGAREESDIVGGGVDWYPTDRTSIAASTEKRQFGRGWDVSLSHRRPLSAWNLSYSRDISSTPQLGNPLLLDPAFRSLYDALAPLIPDPLQREAFVRFLLGYPPIGQFDAFVTNAHFVNRSLSGSVALIGARNVLTLTMQKSDRQRLGTQTGLDPRDDFARFDDIKTRSVSLALSHRLSGISSLNANLTRMVSEGGGLNNEETRRTLFSLAYARPLSPKSSATLTYTHQRSSGLNNFQEHVLTATISMRF